MSGGIIAAVVIVLIVIAGITTCLVAYMRLQRHRADADAVETYRRLAEQVSSGQRELDERMRELTDRTAAIEQLLRNVD